MPPPSSGSYRLCYLSLERPLPRWRARMFRHQTSRTAGTAGDVPRSRLSIAVRVGCWQLLISPRAERFVLPGLDVDRGAIRPCALLRGTLVMFCTIDAPTHIQNCPRFAACFATFPRLNEKALSDSSESLLSDTSDTCFSVRSGRASKFKPAPSPLVFSISVKNVVSHGDSVLARDYVADKL